MPEKSKESDQPKKDFFIDVCLRGSNDLRKILGLDDVNYTRVFFTAHRDARKYYIYGVLDEVAKAGVALMNYQQLLTDVSGENEDHISRLTTTAIVDEQMIWVRKLTEILTELILFIKTNANDYYRHWLLIDHLDNLNRIRSDSKEFYNCDNLNYKHQADEIIQKIQAIEQNINLGDCWYLKNKTGGGKYPGEKLKLTSFRERLQLALTIANPDQKLTLGLTYGQSYGKSSQSLHPNLSNPDPMIKTKDIEVGIARIGTLSAHILVTIRKLLKDRRRKSFVGQLSRVFSHNKYPNQLLKAQINPSIRIGDFVLAFGDLAEVERVIKSKYGYRSFKVRYLAQTPLPSISVDTFPAMYVKKLYARKSIVDKVKENIEKSTPGEPINNRSISDSIRKTMIEMWDKLGLKEYVHGRSDLMVQKIDDYLKSKK